MENNTLEPAVPSLIKKLKKRKKKKMEQVGPHCCGREIKMKHPLLLLTVGCRESQEGTREHMCKLGVHPAAGSLRRTGPRLTLTAVILLVCQRCW